MLTTEEIRAMALARHADFPGADDEIRAGTPVLTARYDTAENGWRLLVTATPGVRLADGRFAAATDPLPFPAFRLRRHQRLVPMAEWAARKVCPVARDVHVEALRVGTSTSVRI